MNLTDNEIIEAFAICYCDGEEECKSCPLLDEEGFCKDVPDSTLLHDVLNLINRQKGEIEELQRKNLSCNEEIKQLNIELQAMRGAANSYKAEAERLKEFIREDQGLILKLTGEPVNEYNQKIKTKAIKEFAERLKGRATTAIFGQGKYSYNIITEQCIDNLVNEMFGGAE